MVKRSLAGVADREVRYRNCPECGDQMRRQNYGRVSGVVVDVCPRHGWFFDAGELQAIIEFVRSGGDALTRQFEQREAGMDASHRMQMAAAAAGGGVKYGSSGAQSLGAILSRDVSRRGFGRGSAISDAMRAARFILGWYRQLSARKAR